MYYLTWFRLWRTKQKIALAMWLTQQATAHLERVILDMEKSGTCRLMMKSRRDYGLGAGITGLFLLDLFVMLSPS